MKLVSFSGIFYKYIYTKDNYMVVSICSSDSFDTYYTCIGELYKFEKNKVYDFNCAIEENPKYGIQYRIVEVYPSIPRTKTQIIKFLSSSYFKGIGKKCATKIYDELGDDALDQIRNNFGVLKEIDLTDEQIHSIISGYELLNMQNKPEITELISAGFSVNEANIISYLFKEKTIEQLHTDPFVFYYECPYISLKSVYLSLERLNIPNSDELRIIGDFVSAFKSYTFRFGHIYLTEDDLDNIFKNNHENRDMILEYCFDKKILIKEDERYYYKDHYHNEKLTAGVISDLLNTNNDEYVSNEEIIDNLSNEIEYDNNQLNAIYNFFSNTISIISGGPGTGKTTLIKEIVNIYKKRFPLNNIIVIAPTGRAAKRINEICDVQSKTIHSLLKWNKEYNYFTHNCNNPLFYDAIIVDEFSMVDNELFARLLDANRHLKKLCLIGDYNQLPSIREGDLLKNFIDSKLFPTTMLSKIFRQDEGNGIIKLANDIVDNRIEFNSYNDDVKFIDVGDYSVNSFIDDLQNDLDSNLTFDDIQVLTPMYKGEFGADMLNTSVQDVYNPLLNKGDVCDFSSLAFRKNDKVLQLKNRSDYDLCNGDIGFINEVDNDNEELLLTFNGYTYVYTSKDLVDGNLDLAYAITIHKSQGSEYKKVYLFIGNNHSHFVDKKILYTAVSRAKQKLIIISSPSILKKCLMKKPVIRKTSIIDFIKNY